MRKALMSVAVLSILALPTLAAAQEGAVAGAVTGAVTGGVVGGPVGAAVGAGVGGIAGAAAEDAAKRGPDNTVVVRPGPEASTGSVGCETRTVTRENSVGDTKTVTTERC